MAGKLLEQASLQILICNYQKFNLSKKGLNPLHISK